MASTGPNHRVHKLGIVVDDFAGLAGATDFIVSFVDGATLAAGCREVVLILRDPPPLCTMAGAVTHARKLLQNVKIALRGGQPPKLLTLEERLEVLHRAGLPDLPILRCLRTDRDLMRICSEHAVDVVGPLTSPPSSEFKIPWIGYIYDFQHKYFPEYFNAKALVTRDILFRSILANANAVVVNSRSVKADAEMYWPGSASRVLALPFSASPNRKWFAVDPIAVRQRYGIGDRYFIVSNQFWLHKRHEVAIRAFAQIAGVDQEVELVLTGETSDLRAPQRLKDITSLITDLRLNSRVHILGLIPKLDQVALVRGAIAMIQPTAFEGGPGGGSVFDATALGVPTIVSDIPINQEIAEYVTSYFELDNVESLASRLRERLMTVNNTRSPETLIEEGAERRRRQGHAIWKAADLAFLHRPGEGSTPGNAHQASI